MPDEPPQLPGSSQEDQPHELILPYRNPQDDRARVAVQRPPRKPLPAALCVGFFGASIVMAVAWMSIAEFWRRTPWMIVVIVSAMAAAGTAGFFVKRSRVASIGVLLALGVWLLMWGPCASLGGV